MTILITGICGFVGNALARLFAAHGGFRLAGVDSLVRRGSEKNVEPLRALGVNLKIADLAHPEALEDIGSADWVIDCSANPSVLAGLDGSSKSLLDQNLTTTMHLLEYCRKQGAGFLLLSTSRVYSIPALCALPLSETDTRFELAASDAAGHWQPLGITEKFSTLPPLSLYGTTKACSEWLALEYGHAFGFPVWINRCGVLAGAGQFGKADQGIFSFWIHSWHARSPLRYIGFGGSGKQVRDCLHPDDLFALVLKQIGDCGSNGRRVFNVAGSTANSLSLKELSEWCAKRFPCRPMPEPSPSERPYDIPWLCLDSSLAQQRWNWAPARSVESILEEIALHAEAHPRWLEEVS